MKDLAFATKPELALKQVIRLMADGERALWAAADEVGAHRSEFRGTLQAPSLAYVIIIPCGYRITVAKDKAALTRQ